MIELRAKDPEALATWLPSMQAEYVAQRVEAGEDRGDAETQGAAQMAQLFPDGAPAEGQYVMDVLEDGEKVGSLWMGRPFSSNRGTWFVFFVEIDQAHRGRGLGRAAMHAAEEWTVANGGTRVALNVFGHNTVARSLYDSLGYRVMATGMYKDVAGSSSL